MKPLRERKTQDGFSVVPGFLIVTAWWNSVRNVEIFRAAGRTWQALDTRNAKLVETLSTATGAHHAAGRADHTTKANA